MHCLPFHPSVSATARACMHYVLSICPFLQTLYLNNVLTEFLYVQHKHLLRLDGSLMRFCWLRIKVRVAPWSCCCECSITQTAWGDSVHLVQILTWMQGQNVWTRWLKVKTAVTSPTKYPSNSHTSCDLILKYFLWDFYAFVLMERQWAGEWAEGWNHTPAAAERTIAFVYGVPSEVRYDAPHDLI